MWYFLVYLMLGLGLALLCYKDDRSVLKIPVLGIVVVVLWPMVVYKLITTIQTIKWQGKVIWERK